MLGKKVPAYQSPIATDMCLSSAGIIGLNVALVLAERGFGDSITVMAEHLPGDTSPGYTSPWYDDDDDDNRGPRIDADN